jgi:hypothetical protein
LDDEFANLIDAYFDKQAFVPVDTVGSTIAVTIDFDLVSVVGFEDDTGSAIISGYLTVKWTEERFTIVADDIDVSVSASSIWTPPLLIVNSLSSAAIVGSDDDVVKFNLNTAQVIWKPRIYTKVTCDSNAFFPFDMQECSIQISSLNLEDTEMTVAVTKSTIGTTLYVGNSLWELKKSSATSYSVQSHPYADFKLTLQRKAQYITLIIVTTTVVTSIVHLFVLLLPQDTDRVKYSITSMLGVLVVLLWVISYVPLNARPVSIIVYYLFIEFLLNVVVLVIAINIFRVSTCRTDSCFENLVPVKKAQVNSGKDDVIRPEMTQSSAATRDVRVSSITSAWDDDEVFEEPTNKTDTTDRSKQIIPPIYMFLLFTSLHILFTIAFFVSLGINLD